MKASPWRFVLEALLVGAALAHGAACRRDTGQPTPSPTHATAAGSAGERGPSPRAGDPRWRRAADGDALNLARLAQEVGALGLLDGVEDEGEIGRVALAALPHADDGDLALRRLGELALAAPSGRASPLLEAILGIAGRPRQPREPLDAEGVRACGEALVTIAGRAKQPRGERALAISAARALAEKGYVDSGRIPKDLDPSP